MEKFQCSSASRKFLNWLARRRSDGRFGFQCSSASRKFLNGLSCLRHSRILRFQCSSASRKFLNSSQSIAHLSSATFQCSSASRKFLNSHMDSPSRKFSKVSVLFSEPKIPQWKSTQRKTGNRPMFQCSSASRKFLNRDALVRKLDFLRFQCSSASRKFLNWTVRPACWYRRVSFSALQRAENSSMKVAGEGEERGKAFQCSSASRKFLNRRSPSCRTGTACRFSALQRAENSSIQTLAPASIHISDRDDHASSFLSLPGASP